MVNRQQQDSTRELERLVDALPHGQAFRFVSKLTAIDPMVSGTGDWNVGGHEPFVAAHFPGEPIVPGVLIVEALAQLCGLVAFGGGEGLAVRTRTARLAQVDVKVRAAVVPPARIELSAKFVRAIEGLLMFEVVATAGGAPAADGRIVLARAL